MGIYVNENYIHCYNPLVISTSLKNTCTYKPVVARARGSGGWVEKVKGLRSTDW